MAGKPGPGPARRRSTRRGIGPFSLRQVALVFGSIVVAAVVLVAITTPLGSVEGAGPIDPRPTAYRIGPDVPGLEPGARAPEFEVALDDGTTFQLRDLDGRPIRLADLRGKAVWVNFWATWCPPCQAETPILREVYESYRDRGLVLVAVDVQETVEAGRSYAERYGLGYTIGADVSGHVLRQFRVSALPTQFFIDPDGRIHSIVAGPLSRATASAYVEAILPEGGSPPEDGSPAPSR